jgi:O-antigen ligase
MKWIFILGLLGLTPTLAGWLRTNPGRAHWVAGLIGFLPFATAPFHLYVAPISWATWPGFVKGAEVALLDAVALAVLLGLPRRTRIRMKAPLLLFLAVAAVSVLQSRVPMAGIFYVWQLVRVTLVFAAVSALCRDDRCPPAVAAGMAIGLGVQAVMAGGDYLTGALQSGGGFGHQNQLGILSHFAIYPALALLLAGRKGVTPIIGPLAGALVAIAGASRATIGLGALGVMTLLLLSMVRRPSGRKTAVAVGGVLALLVSAPLALRSLDRRLTAAPLSGSYDERAAFEKASWMMVADHPLGIGPNGYVVVANTEGYSARAGVIPTMGSRSAHVHNAYLLSAAEMGYLGMVAFTFMLLLPIWVAFRASMRSPKDPRGELLLGVAVALTMVAVHCLYEWVFVTFSTQYLFGIALGLVSGLAGQLGYWKRGRRTGNAGARPNDADAIESREEVGSVGQLARAEG